MVATLRSLCLFTQKLHNVFTLKDMGSTHYFLGIEIQSNKYGLFLSQKKYIMDILERFQLLRLLVLKLLQLLKCDWCLTLSLQHSPKISFSIGKPSQNMVNPKQLDFDIIYCERNYYYMLLTCGTFQSLYSLTVE